MRKPILFFIALFLYGAAISQVVVDPKDFPAETNPQQSNFEFYSRKTGTNKKATFDNVRKRMLPTLSFPNNITYTPSNTGNTANLGQFVTDPNGKIWYIDGLGVAKWVNTPASIALTVADNDEAARLMCVPLNGWYRLSANNTIGAAPGTLRQRIYGAALSLPCTPSTTSAIPGETVIYGGGGILKTSGDPDSNSYVKRQFQWYEASAAWDTVRNELYFYHGADPVGSRWDKFTGGGGLTNGDKVDIDVRGLGDTLIIDTGAVTSVKILDGTIVASDLATTGVTAGSYTNTNLTVNSKGQITAASNGSAAGSSTDSSFVKRSGSYASKKITDNIYRTGKTSFGTSDTSATVVIRENRPSGTTPALMVAGSNLSGDSNNIFIRLRSSAKDSTSDFIMGAINSGTISGAGNNTSYCFGHNYLPGGSRINSSESAEAMMFEDAFVNPLPVIGNAASSEMHWMFVPGIGNPTNIQMRPLSFALDWRGRSGDFSLQTDKINFMRFGTLMGFMPAKPAVWSQLDFYNKVWDFGDTLSLRFAKNNHQLLIQRNAANSAYVNAIKVDASDQVFLGGGGESRVAAYNHLRVTNGGLITNENGEVNVGNATYPNRLYIENNNTNLLTLTKTGNTYSNTLSIFSDRFYFQSSSGNAIFDMNLGAPASSLAINSSGYVGLGTVSPTRTLHVVGEARITDLTTTNPTAFIGADATGVLSKIKLGAGLSFSNDTINLSGGSDLWTLTGSDIYRNSKVRVNSTSAPTEALDVTGNIQGSADLYLGTNFKVFDNGTRYLHKTGTRNLFIAAGSGNLTTTGNDNYAIGRNTLSAITSGGANQAFGDQALKAITTGGSNSGIGTDAGLKITTGSYNTLSGRSSGAEITTGDFNVAVGFNTLNTSTTQSGSTAIGAQSLEGNTAAATTAVGATSGLGTTARTNATYVGYSAGNASTAATQVDVGYFAGASSTATNSVFIGYAAGQGNTTNSALAIDWNSGSISNHVPLISGLFSSKFVGINTGHSALTSALQVTGTGNTSSTYSLVITDSGGDTATATLVARNDGKVSVNDNNPFSALQVVGNIGAYSSSGSQFYIGDDNFKSSGFYNKAPGIGAVFNAAQGVTSDLGMYVYNGSRTLKAILAYNGNFGIGNSAPAVKLDITGTDAIRITTGTTAQKPTGAVGMIRHNSDTGKFEGVRSGTTFENFLMTGDAASASISSLTNATATHSLDILNFPQTWASSTMTTGTPMTWTAAALTSGTGLLHTTNALTTGTIHQLSTTNNSLNSTLGLLYVANNGTSTNGLVASFQSNSTAESGMYVAASGKVGIGETAPVVTLDVRGTDAIQLPRGTTAQRPTGAVGYIRHNSTTSKFEGVRSGTTFENFLMGSDGVSISSLTNATATHSLDILNFPQTWASSTMTTGTPMTWTAAALTSGTGLLHTTNALTTGTIHQLSTTNNSLNSTLGLLYVANNGTSTNGLVASFQSNSTAESGMYVAASGKVGIGETAPLVTLDVRGTDAIQLPRGTTAQRPGSPTSGMVRMNDDVNILEYYDGSAWASINGLLPTEGYTNVTSTSSPVTLTNAQRDNLINQGGTQATFTFNLPASPINGQLCYLSFNNIVTTLTISGNGTTLNGTAATTAAVGTRLEYKYYSSASAWIRVQ